MSLRSLVLETPVYWTA